MLRHGMHDGVMEENKLITTAETARMLGLHPGTVRNWRQRQQGPAFVRVGSRIRYRIADVESWITYNHQGVNKSEVAR